MRNIWLIWNLVCVVMIAGMGFMAFTEFKHNLKMMEFYQDRIDKANGTHE